MLQRVPTTVPARIRALRRFAISITVFNLLGLTLLGFEQAYLTQISGLITAYSVELLLETLLSWAAGRRPRFLGPGTTFIDFLLPAHITGLACAMLLYGNDSLAPTVFAATVAVASKYIVRIPIGGALRHVFNPSNLGITVTLLCFSWVAIAPPYHFTENVGGPLDWIIPGAIGVFGLLLNAKLTGRAPLVAGWLGGFFLQALLRAVLLGHDFVAALLPMVGVAFILFTNYMIPDPGTTPRPPARQVGFGVATALVYGALVVAHVTFGLFYALTIVCGVRGLVIVIRSRQESLSRTAPVSPTATPSPGSVPASAGSTTS